ncbi:uncharacterized protein CCOS01_06663 [Colletotrichum costaricense]|uniref:Uncharacterized protein n=1 Tax=Colletotrichum costaricense TaxID=1209916 RepID=A0AAI9YYV5_9PEZI|nr:uncharacterized protein CCOS01_06663 [Colletotrichum costaricense]KAK1528829.1 hypothetical protein CCOS01_06663 [Colletotrichum costaricense]
MRLYRDVQRACEHASNWRLDEDSVPAKQRSLRRKTVVSSEPYETIQQLPSPEQAMASFEHTPPKDQDFQPYTRLRLRNTITYQLCLICLVPKAFTQAGCSNHSRVFPQFATLGNRLAVRTTMDTDAVNNSC